MNDYIWIPNSYGILHPYGRHCLQAKGYVLWAQGNFDERCKSITVELCHSLVLESTQLMSLWYVPKKIIFIMASRQSFGDMRLQLLLNLPKAID